MIYLFESVGSCKSFCKNVFSVLKVVTVLMFAGVAKAGAVDHPFLSTEFMSLSAAPVSGTVIASDGEPLPGASVLIKGTTQGASTDIDGKFRLNVTDGASVTLVVKYVGFKTKEVVVNSGQTNVTITLDGDDSVLDEVVVIGYGTVKKRDLTGSVASVKSEDITRVPTHNAVDAIQGKIAGADITRSSGAAGGTPNITIRGNRTIMGAQNGPLTIIDGYQGGNINDLNPNDIESIDVLKDASSTAIYGAQGANGVIIVTTKKGAEGKAKVSYDAYYGVNNYMFPEGRTGQDYINLRREAYRTSGLWQSEADDRLIFSELPGEWDALQAGQWVNWVDELKHTGSQQSHAISVTAGSENTKIFASGGIFQEDGMLKNNNYTRYNGRFNIDQKINDWAKVGVLTQATYSKQNTRVDPMGRALTTSPFGTPYDETGTVITYPLVSDATTVSPLADEKNEHIARNNTLRSNMMVNGFVELKPLKGLTFRSSLGTNITSSRQGIYNDSQSLQRYNQRTSFASSESGLDRNLNWDNVLTYNKEVNDHSFTVTGITSYIQGDSDATYADGVGQLLASQLFYGLNSTSTAIVRNIRSPYSSWNNMAYAGRLNYSYKGKYLLTASGRYDGSSRLAAGNKWDFFPSVALGWNMKDEAFLKDVKTISNLKLRASYGVSGNFAIPVYGTQSVVDFQTGMSFGEVAAPAYTFAATAGNQLLGWEKSATTDIGLDLGLWNNRINITADYYNTITSDILLQRTLPISSGVSNVFENIGETRNRGVELGITSENIRNTNLRWSSTLTFSKNKEEITELINGVDLISGERNSFMIGRPVRSFYTFRKLGIWQTDEADLAAQQTFEGKAFQPGDIKLADLNGDGKITADADREYIGSTVPKWVAGLQNTVSYKAFDLNVFAVARYGQMLDAQVLGRFNTSGTGNGPASLDYWTPENPTNDYPRPRNGTSISNYAGYQTLNFVDGSYFKIRNVTLGYTLPTGVASKLKISKLRFYATASNVLTISKSHLVKDYDPERGGSESNPLGSQFVFGLNFNL